MNAACRQSQSGAFPIGVGNGVDLGTGIEQYRRNLDRIVRSSACNLRLRLPKRSAAACIGARAAIWRELSPDSAPAFLERWRRLR